MFDSLRIWYYTRRLKCTDAKSRVIAVKHLGRVCDARAVDILIPVLENDSDTRVRIEAASSLGKQLGSRAVDALVARTGPSSPPVLICAAAEALGRLNDVRASDPLKELLADFDPRIRVAAASALAMLGKRQWLQLVRGDDGDLDRLGTSGDEEAVEPLGYAFTNCNCAAYRCRIVTSLAQLGGSGARRRLRCILEDENLEEKVRCAAATALGTLGLGDCETVSALVQSATSGSDSLRRSAAAALAGIGYPKWAEWIRGDCYDWNRLGSSGDPVAVEPLISLLHIPRLRATAANAICLLGARPAVDPLIGFLARAYSYSDIDICCTAAQILGRLGDRRAVPEMLFALRRPDGAIRKAAAAALAMLGHPKWAQWIKGDEPYDIHNLGASGDAEAVGILILHLANLNEYVRKAAVAALAALGHPQWGQWVKGDLQDFSRLGASGDERLLAPLDDVSRDTRLPMACRSAASVGHSELAKRCRRVGAPLGG